MNWEYRWRKKTVNWFLNIQLLQLLFIICLEVMKKKRNQQKGKLDIEHQTQFIWYTHNYLKKWFSNEEYELITNYKNWKQKLTYKYHGRLYKATFNEWLWHYNPPHLRKNGNICLVLRIFTFSFFCFCFDFFHKAEQLLLLWVCLNQNTIFIKENNICEKNNN